MVLLAAICTTAMDRLLFIAIVTLTILSYTTTQVIGQDDLPQRWNVFQFPNPQTDLNRCGRNKVSSVCDPKNIISDEDADAIDELISDVYRETTCLCFHCITNKHGYIIKVAILPEMERVFPDRGNTTYERLRDTQMYSYILTRQWGMEGACNESLLILYARNEGILFTLTRQHTRLKLSDDDVKRISLDVRHYFDNSETVADGIKEMIRRYRLVFEGRREEALQPRPARQQG